MDQVLLQPHQHLQALEHQVLLLNLRDQANLLRRLYHHFLQGLLPQLDLVYLEHLLHRLYLQDLAVLLRQLVLQGRVIRLNL